MHVLLLLCAQSQLYPNSSQLRNRIVPFPRTLSKVIRLICWFPKMLCTGILAVGRVHMIPRTVYMAAVFLVLSSILHGSQLCECPYKYFGAISLWTFRETSFDTNIMHRFEWSSGRARQSLKLEKLNNRNCTNLSEFKSEI